MDPFSLIIVTAIKSLLGAAKSVSAAKVALAKAATAKTATAKAATAKTAAAKAAKAEAAAKKAAAAAKVAAAKAAKAKAAAITKTSATKLGAAKTGATTSSKIKGIVAEVKKAMANDQFDYLTSGMIIGGIRAMRSALIEKKSKKEVIDAGVNTGLDISLAGWLFHLVKKNFSKTN